MVLEILARLSLLMGSPVLLECRADVGDLIAENVNHPKTEEWIVLETL
jgi:hypothetical protein